MAAKKKTVEASGDNPHVVNYTEENGEEITATFPTEEHSKVLRNRLNSHNIPHVYSGPKSEE